MFLDALPKEDFKLILRVASANWPDYCDSLDTHKWAVSTIFVVYFLMVGKFFKPKRPKVNNAETFFLFKIFINVSGRFA